MSIKTRLRMTYFAMLIVPVILIILLSHIFTSYMGGSSRYDLGDKMNNYTSRIISENNSFNNDTVKELLKSPDKLLDKNYLSQLNKETGLNHTGIILRVDNTVTFASDNIKTEVMEELLPAFNGDLLEQKNKDLYILSKQDFYFTDGRAGSIFYALNTNGFKNAFRENSLVVIITALIILTLSTGVLTYWVSKTIIKPLKELEKAADEIKQGNLEYSAKICTRDEIGQVSYSFEEMRLKLKRSLELQQQYEENRKELISNISHDLKTPITAIKGYVEGIKDGVADTPEKMNKYVSTIYSKATYMDSLINDLFLYSKLDLNKVPFKFQEVDIVNYIKDCVEEISFDLNPDLVQINSKVPEKSIMVKIDVQELKRTIMNIVGNSIKYKDDGKLNIDISLKEAEGKINIEIRDNGKGISKEALPYIFDRFYRAEASRETTIGGSGLGLAISKKIIEEHGGVIWAESQLGKGTTIGFVLNKLLDK
jgi:histidine kinase